MASRYRADQVGSLLRPPELLAARTAHAEGRLPGAELRQLEDDAIHAALERQQQIGIDVLTDGELRRDDFMDDFIAAVEGFVPSPGGLEWRGAGAAGNWQGVVVGGKLRQTRRLTAHETGFLKQHARGPVKVTLPSPNQFGYTRYRRGVSDQYYPTPEDLLRDVAGILRAEVDALIAEGVDYVQFDAPVYTHFLDPRIVNLMRERGVERDQVLPHMIAADNACVESLHRDGLTLAFHLCRGNNRSSWLAEGGYDPWAEQVFGGLDFDAFLWSTIASGPVGSSRCGSCHRARPSC
jgi:5-methyltetrahydropteroyltriglutamate--homocysteine methyltransferase